MARKFFPSKRQNTKPAVRKKQEAAPAQVQEGTWREHISARKAQLKILVETAKGIKDERSLQGLFQAKTNKQRINRMEAVARNAENATKHGYLTDAEKDAIQRNIDQNFQRKMKQATALVDNGFSIRNAARTVCGVVGITLDKSMRYNVLQKMEAKIEEYHDKKIYKAKESLYTNASLKKAAKLNAMEEKKVIRDTRKHERNLKRDAIYTPESAAITELTLIKEAYLAMKALPQNDPEFNLEETRDEILATYAKAHRAVEEAVVSSGYDVKDLHKMIGIQVRNICNVDPEMKMMFADFADGAVAPSEMVTQTVKVAGIGEKKRQIWDGTWRKTEADSQHKSFISFAPRIPLNEEELTERMRVLMADAMNCLENPTEFADFYTRVDQVLSDPDKPFETTGIPKADALLVRTAELAKCAQYDGMDTKDIMKVIEPGLTVDLKGKNHANISAGEMALYMAGAAVGIKAVDQLRTMSQEKDSLKQVADQVAAMGEVMHSGDTAHSSADEYKNLKSILEMTGNYDPNSIFGSESITQEISGTNQSGSNLMVDAVQNWNRQRIQERQDQIFKDPATAPQSVAAAKTAVYRTLDQEKGFAGIIKQWGVKGGQIGSEVPDQFAQFIDPIKYPMASRGYDSTPAETVQQPSAAENTREPVYDEYGNLIAYQPVEAAPIQPPAPEPALVNVQFEPEQLHHQDVQTLQEAADTLQLLVPAFCAMASVGCMNSFKDYAAETNWNPNWDGPERGSIQLNEPDLSQKVQLAALKRAMPQKTEPAAAVEALETAMLGKIDITDTADEPHEDLSIGISF